MHPRPSFVSRLSVLLDNNHPRRFPPLDLPLIAVYSTLQARTARSFTYEGPRERTELNVIAQGRLHLMPYQLPLAEMFRLRGDSPGGAVRFARSSIGGAWALPITAPRYRCKIMLALGHGHCLSARLVQAPSPWFDLQVNGEVCT